MNTNETIRRIRPALETLGLPPGNETLARRIETRLSRIEAAALWAVRRRLQHAAPPGKQVSTVDALRHVLQAVYGALEADMLAGPQDPLEDDLDELPSPEEQALPGVCDPVEPSEPICLEAGTIVTGCRPHESVEPVAVPAPATVIPPPAQRFEKPKSAPIVPLKSHLDSRKR